jgi:hypothetical protein
MHSILSQRAVFFAACLVLAGCGADAFTEPSNGLLSEGEELAPWHESVLRARTTRIAYDVTRGERSPFAPEPTPAELRLQLFDDVVVDAELARLRRGHAGFSWIGRVEGDDEGEVLLSVADGIYAGSVRWRGRLFQILHRHGGEHVVIERDDDRVPDEVPPVVPSLFAADPAAPSDPQGAVQIDIMVAYTSAARQAVGGAAAMAALADLAIAETNQGYQQSGVEIELRLVHSVETSYGEAGFDWQQTLARLAGKSDGYMDELHALRDAHGADHVVLLVDTVGPYAGIGYLMTEALAPSFASAAFAVVAHEYATGAYTFGHELGHNMGAQHDVAHASSDGFTPYAHGLQVPAASYRTLMAYACEGGGCPRINRWSNPSVVVGGAPSGIEGAADNAATLALTAPICAGFRASVVPPPTVAMIEPEDGATLPAGPVKFRWSEGDGQLFLLQLGLHPGDESLYASPALWDSEVTVEGLPESGERIHARLWWRDPQNSWHYHDYGYTAASAAAGAHAVIVYPPPGSTLPGTAVPFLWRPGDGEAFHLEIRSATGEPLYASAVDRAGVLVDGLPHDGRALSARLWSRVGAVWQFHEAAYRAHAAPPYAAVITQPTEGASLPRRVTFRWSATAASAHMLVLRSEGELVFSGSASYPDGLIVSELPQDGRELVATLYSLGDQGWASTSERFVLGLE